MRVSLGPGPEFDLIRRLLGPERPLPPGVTLGPGDDALVLEGGVVVSSDLTVEGVHFRREWITLEEAGYRAVAAALSDLAAMAAEPLGALLSLALPREGFATVAEAIQRGADQACQREGIQVLGGDLSASPGPLVMDVVVLGRTASPVLRSGSLPGDEVWVTGWLGGSAAAVRLWKGGDEPSAALREAFARPRPRIREARWLAVNIPIRSMLDLSDGLAGDVAHLAAGSGTAVHLSEALIPLHPALGDVVPDPGERLGLALTGGEDYEVCFTAPPGRVEGRLAEFREHFDLPLTRIGVVRDGAGVFLETAAGETTPLTVGGFNHFLGGTPG